MAKRTGGKESGESRHEKTDGNELSRRAALGAMGLAGLGLMSGPAAAEHENQKQPWYHWDGNVDAEEYTLRRLGALEMAANSETITDFAGENLSIDDGVLEAVGSTVDFVDIDDYGADPTGEEPSDDALDAAIDELEDGDYLLITNGNYWFDDQHIIHDDHVTVLGTGSQLRITGVEYDAWAYFLAFGSWEEELVDFSPQTTIAEDAREGQQVIEVEDPSAYSEGDTIIVSESKHENKPWILWGGNTGRGTAPTTTVIREIDGSRLHLDRGLNYDHDAGNAGVYLLDPVVGGRFVDLHMAEGEGENESESFLQTGFARDCMYINCTAEEYVGFPFTDILSLRTVMIDCTAKNPVIPEGRASSHWEPFQLRGSTDPTIVRPRIDTCRRGIDINAGAKVVRVFDPRISNAYLHGMCFHSNATSQVYGAYEVYGGRVAAAEEVLHDKYHFGAGLSLSPNMSHVKVVGTTVVGRSRAIHTPYGKAENLTVEGANLETFESDPPDTLQTGFITAINGNLENSQLEDVTVVSRGGNDSRAIHLSGAENVRLSGRVYGSPEDTVVYVGNGQNVSLDIDVLDNDDVDVPDVTIEDARNVRVTGNLHGSGRSVATRGDVVDARIDDVDAEGDVPPIGHVGGDGNLSNIWVTGCNTVGAGNSDIDFESDLDGQIHGLWIQNNVCDEISFQGSASDEDKFVSDNLTGQHEDRNVEEMDGSGTEDDPYVAANAYHLQQIADEPDAHYVLGNDIDASGTADWNFGSGFEPISAFNGTLDGRGHTIEGLSIDRPGAGWVGLFAEAQSAAKIRNLEFVDVDVTGSSYTGGLVGVMRECEVTNVSLSGSVEGGRRTGGLFGLQEGLAEDVSVDVDVSSGSAQVGGIGGDMQGTIRNSTATGSVSGDHETGGISGWNNGGTIEGSHADVTVEGTSHSIGGLSGIVIYGGTVSDSSAAGDVSGPDFVGGFTGVVYGRSSGTRVETSTASGAVSGEEAVGGFAGAAYNDVEDCYAEGSVHATEDQAGGLAGLINDNGNVATSYAVGEVSGNGDVGGLAGRNTGTLADSYWDTEVTGQSDSVGSGDPGGEGLTTAEMTGDAAAENMDALDFEETWATTNTYPVLQWQAS